MAEVTTSTDEGTELAQNLVHETASRVREILSGVRSQFVDISDATKALAMIVVDVRARCIISVKSAKTGNMVSVPAWTGKKSPDFTYWRDTVLNRLIEEMIPDEYRPTFRKRLDNQVQEEAHRRATKTHKAHLGMAAQSKSATQAAKRAEEKKAASDGAGSGERPTDVVFNSDAYRDGVKEASTVKEAAQLAAAACVALDDRTRNLELSKTETADVDVLIRRCISALMSTRVHIGTATPSKSAQAKSTANKVAA